MMPTDAMFALSAASSNKITKNSKHQFRSDARKGEQDPKKKVLREKAGHVKQ